MYTKHVERARMNVLQALQDRNAVRKVVVVLTKDIDDVVGDLSRYARANTKILQTLLRDGLIGLDFETPMKIWMTPRGRNYLCSEE